MTGPVFDGRAKEAAQRFAEDAAQAIAQQGVDAVRARFRQVLQNPTGRLSSRVTVERAHNGYVVTDGGVVYGPWIEGVGSRNRTSRFKGYRTFRIVGQQFGREAGPTAERMFRQYLGEMQ